MEIIEIEADIEEYSLQGKTEEELEKLIDEKIKANLVLEIVKKLDDMAYVDMEHNPDEGTFTIKASLVLCSKQDIVSSMEEIAQKLAGNGLGQDEIEGILSIFTETKKGF